MHITILKDLLFLSIISMLSRANSEQYLEEHKRTWLKRHLDAPDKFCSANHLVSLFCKLGKYIIEQSPLFENSYPLSNQTFFCCIKKLLHNIEIFRIAVINVLFDLLNSVKKANATFERTLETVDYGS